MSEEINKPKRRDFLFTATYAIGAVGLGATIWPLIDQMNPDSSVKALSTTEVDISNLEPGKAITVLWRGKPIFIRRRTQKEIDEAAAVDLKDLKKNKNIFKKKKFKIICLKSFLLLSPFLAFLSFQISLKFIKLDNFFTKIIPGHLLFIKLNKLY